MEFTKLLKYGSASLFLILVIHGLVLGFTIPTTVISVVLVSVVCLFEAQLVKSERDQLKKEIVLMVAEFEKQVKQVSDRQVSSKEELLAKLEHTKEQIGTLRLAAGVQRR